MWPKLREHAAAAKMPEGGDTFMFKHHGLFNVQPAQPGFMCRMRIPACKLTADQLAAWATSPRTSPAATPTSPPGATSRSARSSRRTSSSCSTGLYDLGLTCKGSGADSVRNITANPTAGFDPQELIDLSPYAKALHLHILNTPSLHGIPRKFNIAFDGGGVISAVVDTNDIGFVAHKLTDEYLAANPDVAEACPDGIVIRILLGGITGHHDFAISSGFACTPDQMNDFAIATLDVFTENGDRTNRKKARLKYVLDDWGHVKFTETVEERLGFKLLRLPEGSDPAPRADRPPGPHRCASSSPGPRSDPATCVSSASRSGSAGCRPSRCAASPRWPEVRAGRHPPDRLAERAHPPRPRRAEVDAAVAELNALGLDVSASSFAAGVVACTGKFACQYASAHTKEHGRAGRAPPGQVRPSTPRSTSTSPAAPTAAPSTTSATSASSALHRRRPRGLQRRPRRRQRPRPGHRPPPHRPGRLRRTQHLPRRRHRHLPRPPRADETFLAFTRRHDDEQLADSVRGLSDSQPRPGGP